jgi:hypothetical protein
MRNTYLAAAFGAVVFSVPVAAQDSSSIERRLNDSDICAPLKLDIVKVARLLGLPIPKVELGFLGEVGLEETGLDLSVGWDKNRHTVDRFEMTDDRVKTEITFGCQPGANGEIVKRAKLNPDDYRITDRGTCTADIVDDRARNVECRISGEGAKFIANRVNLEEQLREILSNAV